MRGRHTLQVALLALVLISGDVSAAAPRSTPLSPPSLAAAAVSASQIHLSWTDPNGNESGFSIERSVSSGSGFTQIGTATRNTTAYEDTGLAAGATYYYRVRAFGKGKSFSAYSNEASATTVAPDTTAPSVVISSPASGTSYTTAQTVMVTATASDNVGATRVEFYDGATLRCTAMTAAYTCAWAFTSANNGPHSWTARAYD